MKPQKITLASGEEILWRQERPKVQKTRSVSVMGILIAAVLAVKIFWGMSFLGIVVTLVLLTVFLFILGNLESFSITGIVVFLEQKTWKDFLLYLKNRKITYGGNRVGRRLTDIITNKRIFLQNGTQETAIANLFCIEYDREHKTASFITRNRGVRAVMVCLADNFEEGKKQLDKIWLEYGSLAPVNRKIKDFTSKKQLKFEADLGGFVDDGAKIKTTAQLKFKGKIADRAISIRLGYKTEEKSSLTFQINCPNPRGLYFEMTPESNLNKIANNLGIGDHKIGNQLFDDSFRIKTNNPPQLENTLTERMQSSFLEVLEKSTSARFKFGEPSKSIVSKKGKVKDDVDVLDLHLLERSEENAVIYNEDPLRKSFLSYEGDYDCSLEKLIAQVDIVFNVLEQVVVELEVK